MIWAVCNVSIVTKFKSNVVLFWSHHRHHLWQRKFNSLLHGILLCLVFVSSLFHFEKDPADECVSCIGVLHRKSIILFNRSKNTHRMLGCMVVQRNRMNIRRAFFIVTRTSPSINNDHIIICVCVCICIARMHQLALHSVHSAEMREMRLKSNPFPVQWAELVIEFSSCLICCCCCSCSSYASVPNHVGYIQERLHQYRW